MISTGVPTEIRIYAWAIPADGITLDDLITEFEKNGTQMLVVDRENNRIKIVDETQEL